MKVRTKYIFGCGASEVRNPIHVGRDAEKIMYPAGHAISVYDPKHRTFERLPGSIDSLGVRAMASTLDRTLLAVAERGTAEARVSIFDVSEQKTERLIKSFSTKDGADVLSLSFSGDGSRLLILGGAPEWNLTYWNWKEDDSVKIASALNALTKKNDPDDARLRRAVDCIVSPVDKNLCALVGGEVVKNFRVSSNAFNEIPLGGTGFSSSVYGSATCTCWLPNMPNVQLIGTSSGNIVAIESGCVKGSLRSSPKSTFQILSIAPSDVGFVCGCNGGRVLEFVSLRTQQEDVSKDDDVSSKRENEDVLDVLQSFELRETHVVQGEKDEAVIGIAARAQGRSFVCATSSNQVYSIEMRDEFGDPVDSDATDATVAVAPLVCGFHRPARSDEEAPHSAAITGLDVCRRRPLVVTCGQDRTVRLWNFMEGICELEQRFAESTLSVAIHPSGYQVLIGFEDKLRLVAVFFDRLVPLKEFSVKHCRECRFSDGGQYFACAYNNAIQIFNTYSCTLMQKLTGHTGRVQSLRWTDFDSKLLSSGLGGSIYLWNVHDGKRDEEYVKKGLKFTAAVCDSNAKMVFAVGDDRHLKKLTLPDAKVGGDIGVGVQLLRIAMTNHERYPTLFAGTSPSGGLSNVRTVKPSILRTFRSLDLSEAPPIPAANGPVTRLGVAHDDSHVFVAGDDGTLTILSLVDDADDDVNDTNGGAATTRSYSADVLIAKPVLDEKRTTLAELEAKVKELESHYKYQFKIKNNSYNENIKEIEEDAQHRVAEEEAKFEELNRQKEHRAQINCEELEKLRDIQLHELQRVEAEYQQMVMTEVERHQELKQQLIKFEADCAEQRGALVASHEQEIERTTLDWRKKLETEQSYRKRSEEDLDAATKSSKEERQQLCEDIDTEIENMKRINAEQLDGERVALLRLKGENGIMRKKFSSLTKDIGNQREEIKSMLDKEKRLHQRMMALKQEIEGYEDLIHEKDSNLAEKERAIHGLKKKNQELEKFKFVLDYKIKELKLQIEPREGEIVEMRERIALMDGELERYHNTNASLDDKIGELRRSLDENQKKVFAMRDANRGKSNLIDRFKSDLYDAVQNIQQPEMLRQVVRKMCDTYGRNGKGAIADEIDDDVAEEVDRQGKYMQRTIRGLKRCMASRLESTDATNRRLISENMALIKEIGDLRKRTRAVRLQTDAKVPTKRRDSGIRPETIAKLKSQRQTIIELKAKIDAAEEKIRLSRPVSRGERLPPLPKSSGGGVGLRSLPPMDGEYDSK